MSTDNRSTETAVGWIKHPTWNPGDQQPRLADGWDGVRITKDGGYEVLKHPERRDAEWWRVQCMEADQVIGALTAENDRLRAVLCDLLQDTQHAEHRCADPDCPVKRAREMLEQ